MTPAQEQKIERFGELLPEGLKDYWNEIIDIINQEHLQPQDDLLNQERQQLTDRILCLESICLMHGITDLNLWLAKGSGYLQNQAREFMVRGVVQGAERLLKNNLL